MEPDCLARMGLRRSLAQACALNMMQLTAEDFEKIGFIVASKAIFLINPIGRTLTTSQTRMHTSPD